MLKNLLVQSPVFEPLIGSDIRFRHRDLNQQVVINYILKYELEATCYKLKARKMNKLVNLETNEMIMTEEGEILGLFVLKNKESIKSKIYFTHKKPNLYTRITLKFILLDESEIDIEPTVRIEKGASLTNTYLRVDTLLLSKNARAHVVPSMEILEDEVKGGHGATIGMIDENQIWYLMSRGITKKEAEKILIEAFVNSLIQETDNPEIKEKFEKELEKLKLD